MPFLYAMSFAISNSALIITALFSWSSLSATVYSPGTILWVIHWTENYEGYNIETTGPLVSWCHWKAQTVFGNQKVQSVCDDSISGGKMEYRVERCIGPRLLGFWKQNLCVRMLLFGKWGLTQFFLTLKENNWICFWLFIHIFWSHWYLFLDGKFSVNKNSIYSA